MPRYVYYGCSRVKDIHCKSGCLREEELIEQLVKRMDQIDVNEISTARAAVVHEKQVRDCEKGRIFTKPAEIKRSDYLVIFSSPFLRYASIF